MAAETRGLVDDKSQHCIPFILERLEAHRQRYAQVKNAPPFFLGLNGVQGAGKTVLLMSPTIDMLLLRINYPFPISCHNCYFKSLFRSLPDRSIQVSIIQATLENPPYSLPTVVFSLDDLYLTHADQVHLAHQHPENPLLQHRGQPSTHDINLAKRVFLSLSQYIPTGIPQYNKAAFNGQGDRVPEDDWQKVNLDGKNVIKVVLFEGWSVGFRPLSEKALNQKWEEAVVAREAGNYVGRLGHNTLENIASINRALSEYDQITDQLDAFIHIDASDLQYVYKWRLEQEAGLRAMKGSGMTDDQVMKFVHGYYPAYELFTDNMRSGIFANEKGRQLRLIVGKDRRVQDVVKI